MTGSEATRPPVAVNNSRLRRVELTMRNIGCLATVTAAVVAVIGLSGCGSTVAGVAVAADPGMVATAPTATAVPSSITTTATLAELVADATSGAVAFWRAEGAPGTDVEVVPVAGDLTCAAERYRTSGAILCTTKTTDLLKYRPEALQEERDRGGDLAVVITTAHEVGHAAQASAGLFTAYRSESAQELSADCASGAYIRSTGADPDAVRRALAATALGEYHTALAAFNEGFTGAVQPMSCLTNYLK